MKLHKSKIQAYLIFVAHFLNFAGYYVFLMILTNLGFIAFSRNMTIPLRLLIVFCLLLVVGLNRKLYINAPTRIFIAFAGIYIGRIFYEMLNGRIYHLLPLELLLYFIAFGVFPFIIISNLKLKASDYDLIRTAILVSCMILSFMTIFFYKNIIGTVGRISEAVSKDENYISPLALSYCGTMSIGLGISYLMENKVTVWKKTYIIGIITLSLIPFYLGSSRGSIFALFLPFMMVLLCKRNITSSIGLLFMMLVIGILGVYLSGYFGSNLVNRFTNIETDISEGSTSAVRIDLWKAGLNQFMNNPIFGNSLEVDKFKFHPHNIFIEVLLSTGIVGFIPFAVLVLKGFKSAANIFRNYPAYTWMGVLFLQCIIQNMFSGALYGASWFWLSLGLLFSFEFSLKKQESRLARYDFV